MRTSTLNQTSPTRHRKKTLMVLKPRVEQMLQNKKKMMKKMRMKERRTQMTKMLLMGQEQLETPRNQRKEKDETTTNKRVPGKMGRKIPSRIHGR